MTQDIIAMARKAGFHVYEGAFPFEPTEDKFIGFERNLEKFAELVKADLFTYGEVKAHIKAAIIIEREACAKLCEGLQDQAESIAKCFDAYAEDCAAAIRARGDK